MMYPPTRVQIVSENQSVLFQGIVSDLTNEFMEYEIKHVWGQADLDGMKITIKNEG